MQLVDDKIQEALVRQRLTRNDETAGRLCVKQPHLLRKHLSSHAILITRTMIIAGLS